MAKRMQEQKEGDRIVAKSKPTAMNVTSTVSSSSSSVNHPIASKSPGILKASTGKPDARARRNSKPDAASSSQGRLKDAYLGGLMVEVAGNLPRQMKVRNHGNFLNLIHGGIMREKSQGNLLHPEIQEIQGIPKLEGEMTTKISSVSSSCTSHGESLLDRTKGFIAEVQRMNWMISTWTALYGTYSWTSNCKLQFILVETIWRIYDLPRINS